MSQVFLTGSRYLLSLLGLAVLIPCVVSLLRQRLPSPPEAYLRNTANGDRIDLIYWENSIGRNSSNDIVFNYNTTSRYHGVISRRRDGWYVTDTGSSVGVFVNGKKIKKTQQIQHGDKIMFGGAALVFETKEGMENDVVFNRNNRRGRV
ncbi:MAG: FHA domain-containing protein [Clostridiales bacterium]|nr:FHA domain-containing protein [Clostridiales bacterium]